MANDLLNDAWVQDFLGGEMKPPDLPINLSVPSGTFNSSLDVYIDISPYATDTIVQRTTDSTPESGTGLYMLLGAAGWGGVMAFRAWGRLGRHAATRTYGEAEAG